MSIIGDGVETDLTYNEAQAILSEPGYDAYGRCRLYAIIADGECAGQIAAIKSQYYLDRHNYSRIYSVTR
ncbi:MAG: hypothetical protein WAV90_02490 [Gordonia amarae]